MEKFIAHHAAQVSCTLSGFDRLVFRGTLLPLIPDHAMFHLFARRGEGAVPADRASSMVKAVSW